MANAAYDPEKIQLLLIYGADPRGLNQDGTGFSAHIDNLISEFSEEALFLATESDDWNAATTAKLEKSRALVLAAMPD